MTSEVAAQTRQQLPFNQAILQGSAPCARCRSAASQASAATSMSSSLPMARRSGGSAWPGMVRSGGLRWVRSIRAFSSEVGDRFASRKRDSTRSDNSGRLRLCGDVGMKLIASMWTIISRTLPVWG